MITCLSVIVFLCLPTAITTFRGLNGLNGRAPNMMPFSAPRHILPVLVRSNSFPRPQMSSSPMLESSSIQRWIRPPPVDFEDEMTVAPRHMLTIPANIQNGGFLDLSSLMAHQDPSIRFSGRQFSRPKGSSSFLRPQITKSMLTAALMRQYPKLNDEEKFWLTRDQKLIAPHGAFRMMDDENYEYSDENLMPMYAQSPRSYPKMKRNRYDPGLSYAQKRKHPHRNYYDQRRRHRTKSERDWSVDVERGDYMQDEDQTGSGEVKIAKRKKGSKNKKNQSKLKTFAKEEKDSEWQVESDSIGLEDQNLPVENENVNGYDYENLSEEPNVAHGEILRVSRRNMTVESR